MWKVGTSADAIHWKYASVVTLPGLLEGDETIENVIFAGGRYVAAGDSANRTTGIYTSSTGTAWTRVNCPVVGTLHSVAYGASRYVAVGSVGEAFPVIMTSPDGKAWQNQAESIGAITYGRGMFVAAGSPDTVLISPDGATWSRRHTGSATWVSSIASSPSGFVAVGTDILSSQDAATWTVEIAGPPDADLIEREFTD